jgi:hypothetical protein
MGTSPREGRGERKWGNGGGRRFGRPFSVVNGRLMDGWMDGGWMGAGADRNRGPGLREAWRHLD